MRWLSTILKFSILGLTLLTSQYSFAGDAEVKACLKKAVMKENPIYQVAEDLDKAGRYSRYLVLICEGDSAKGLYNAINEQTYPGDWPGKTTGDLKYLGETGGVSLCYHITHDSEGERADKYNCSIRLSISSAVLGKTILDGMNAFNLNK